MIVEHTEKEEQAGDVVGKVLEAYIMQSHVGQSKTFGFKEPLEGFKQGSDIICSF